MLLPARLTLRLPALAQSRLPGYAALVLAALLASSYQAVLSALAHPAMPARLLVASLLLAMLLPGRYPKGPAVAILLRGLCLCLGGYALLLSDGFPRPEHMEARWFIELGPALAALSAVLAWWRPGWALVPVTFVILHKALAASTTGVDLSMTDYQPLLDVALLLCFGATALSLLPAHQRSHAALLLFLCAVAVHFGNYFWSGLEKLRLDGPWWRWLAHNETSNLLLAAQALGTLPLSDALATRLYPLIAASDRLLAVVVVASQLACLACISHRGRLIAITLFYDLTHLLIFLLTGILFWKWILLNIAIVLAARTLPRIALPRREQLALVLLIPCAAGLFYAAKLGWYDTRALVAPRLVAVDSDGQRTAVPSNYFLAASVTAAQHRLTRPDPLTMGTGTFGNAASDARRRAAEADCPALVTRAGDEGVARFAAFLQQHHRFVLSRLDPAGRLAYDRYPHHIFSSPGRYPELPRLDLRRIERYELTFDALCLEHDGTGFAPELIEQARYTIPLDGPPHRG
ncbi:MAG: hypothetical protein AAGI15_16535 [Pseudomonadota bacterium]